MVDAQDEKKTKESLGWASYEPFHRECFYVTGIHPRNQNLIKKKYFIPISRIPVVARALKKEERKEKIKIRTRR